ncbi:MAG: response regulator transcription factor [Pseudomonadota bacterium]
MEILIVEDVEPLARNLKCGFEEHAFQVDLSHSGEDAFFKLSTRRYDLVILDWMLPKRSGLEVLAQVRKLEDWTPVIMLTARDSVDDRVAGLETGADDYLVKPFAFAELLARVNSHLRREALMKSAAILELGELILNIETRSATRDCIELNLTDREFDLLVYLCRRRGQVVTRQMLVSDVWKVNARATPMDAVIDVSINRLRKKVDVPFDRKLIRTIRGLGYKIEC